MNISQLVSTKQCNLISNLLIYSIILFHFYVQLLLVAFSTLCDTTPQLTSFTQFTFCIFPVRIRGGGKGSSIYFVFVLANLTVKTHVIRNTRKVNIIALAVCANKVVPFVCL